MIRRVGDGPGRPPEGARVTRMRAWDRYSATVWQLGDRVGCTWDVRPTWTDDLLDGFGRPKCPTPKQSEWDFPPGTAEAYFDQLAGCLREMGSDR